MKCILNDENPTKTLIGLCCLCPPQAGWEACGLWSGRGGLGRHQKSGRLRQQQWQNQRQDHRLWLRPALNTSRQPVPHAPWSLTPLETLLTSHNVPVPLRRLLVHASRAVRHLDELPFWFFFGFFFIINFFPRSVFIFLPFADWRSQVAVRIVYQNLKNKKGNNEFETFLISCSCVLKWVVLFLANKFPRTARNFLS